MTTLHVTDMTCSGCVNAITRAVTALDRTARIAADLDTRQLRIDSALPAETLAEAVRDAGFTVDAVAA